MAREEISVKMKLRDAIRVAKQLGVPIEDKGTNVRFHFARAPGFVADGHRPFTFAYATEKDAPREVGVRLRSFWDALPA